jgi:peptide/nickel transport system permease protein
MLSNGRQYLMAAPWIATFPGLAIMFTSLGINLLGDWLRDALDPRLRRVKK